MGLDNVAGLRWWGARRLARIVASAIVNWLSAFGGHQQVLG